MEGGDLRMSNDIEERVVQMKFDNAAFLRGVDSTLRALQSLNKGLQMQGATKGLTDIGAAAQKQAGSLKGIETGVNSIADRFKAMSVVATTALATVAHQAVMTGGRLAKSLTLEPLMQGFREYETNLNSIQTVLANTAHAGTNLRDVNKALAELNEYSDQTIYNFSEMAKNIGTFTAAGVSLEKATGAIKGIANLAAVSGSNSQQASAAMYQLSQALAAGKVSLEDWNSVVNAGMGGKVFQDALMETARVHGVAIDKMVKDAGSFRLTLQEGWLTGEILNDTLMTFTGDLNAAQLKSMGYNEKQIKGIMKMAKVAVSAATEVKTFTQLMSTIQESVGSGWARTWELIFGNFEEAKATWTAVNNVIGEFIEGSADARNKLISDWKAMGGRAAIIDAIKNAFNGLLSIMRPISQAFRQIFPAVTAKQLYEMSVAIRDFAAGLKIGGTTANNLKRTFAGFFAVLGIGWELVKQLAIFVLRLFGVIGEGSGDVLKTTASIGDFLVELHRMLVEGRGIAIFFSTLGKIVAVPIRLIKQLIGFVGSLFENLDGTDAAKGVQNLASKLTPLGKLGEIISVVWGKILGVLDNVMAKFAMVGAWANRTFGDLFDKVSSLMEGLDFGDVLSGINTGLFAGLVLMLRNLIGGGGAGGLLENIGDAFENLTDSLGAMQNTLRAATLLQIAAAVGILAISMNTLSKIDAAGLTRAGAAISVMFAQLMGSLLLFEKFSGFVGFAKMPFVAASMILLATAVNVLASAMVKLSSLDWNGLAKGLVGVTGLLGGLVAVGKFMPNPAGMITTATGLVILAAAIKILVSAVEDLSGLSWEELGKGLVGVGALLGSLALFTKFAAVGKGGILQGAGLVLLAAGIKILASAVEDMSGLSWGEIARGLVTLAGALGVITAALYLIPPTAPLAAAGVLGVALSLGMVGDALDKLGNLNWGVIGKGLLAMLGSLAIIAAALIVIPPTAPLGAAGLLVSALALERVAQVLDRMGSMNWGAIGKAMVALGGSLLLIAVAVTAMTGALTGAAALLVVAASLAILTPILVTLGGMSWGEIGKGLLVLAAAFVIFGVAGALLTPVVPTLLGLGAAVALLGAGFALAGVGVLAFSAGLAALAVAGAAGTAALVAMVSALIGLIPSIMAAIAAGIVAFAKVIATAGPAMTEAMVVVLMSILNAIAVNTPKIVNQIYKMLLELIKVMNRYAGPLADEGARLIVNILNGLARNVGKMVTAAVNLITQFLKAVGAQQGRVIDAGVKLIISFVNGLANAIRSNTGAMQAAGRNLAMAIIDGMTGGLASGVGRIVSKAREVASSALNAAKSVLGIASPSKEFVKVGKYVVDGFVKGLDGNKDQIDKAFNDMRDKLKDLMTDSAKDVDRLEERLKKLTKARKKDYDEIRKTKKELAQARNEYKKSSAAYSELTKKLKDEHSALRRLADQADAVRKKLDEANQKLADAKKTRDDFRESIRDQLDNLPDATAEGTTLARYVEDLRKQIADTQAFGTAIQRLRELGLSDVMYKELLAKGPAALPFINDILASGKDGVNELNKLSKQMGDIAWGLGNRASINLYQAGVDAAQGLVNGLNAQAKNLEAMMDKLAGTMVNAIKKKLGIKSPSRVFAELGVYAAQGLAQGIQKSEPIVDKSAESVAISAVASIRKSLAAASKMTISDIQPSIRPVLDLTDVKKGAAQMASMWNKRTLSVTGAYAQATDVMAQVNARRPGDDDDTQGRGAYLVYNQTINSPKAVSPAEVYRNTKNQLSTVKGALTK